jgi:hypothetical protein
MTSNTPVSLPPPPPKQMIAILNALIGGLLRSPLHGLLSNSTLVLSFSGRKSGKVYTFPVGYYDLKDESVIVIPLHDWWKNLRDGVPVTVWLKGRQYAGRAEAFYKHEATVKELDRLIRDSANLKRVFKIPLDGEGQPDPNRVRQVAEFLALIRIQLKR